MTTTLAWILAFVFAALWFVALAQLGRMQRRLNEREQEIEQLTAERAALDKALHARLQAHNWPYGFRRMLPSVREWPN
jgi:Tfp pilus assembly protein PilN